MYKQTIFKTYFQWSFRKRKKKSNHIPPGHRLVMIYWYVSFILVNEMLIGSSNFLRLIFFIRFNQTKYLWYFEIFKIFFLNKRKGKWEREWFQELIFIINWRRTLVFRWMHLLFAGAHAWRMFCYIMLQERADYKHVRTVVTLLQKKDFS